MIGGSSRGGEASRERSRDVELVVTAVVDSAFHLHRELGPGLLESVYETVLTRMLEERGLRVERQKAVSFEYQGMHFDDAVRVDLLVEGVLVIELKSVEQASPIHLKQLLTYLRLLDLRVGLLINFGAATFKQGIRRVVNDRDVFAPSRLRVRQASPRAPHDV